MPSRAVPLPPRHPGSRRSLRQWYSRRCPAFDYSRVWVVPPRRSTHPFKVVLRAISHIGSKHPGTGERRPHARHRQASASRQTPWYCGRGLAETYSSPALRTTSSSVASPPTGTGCRPIQLPVHPVRRLDVDRAAGIDNLAAARDGSAGQRAAIAHLDGHALADRGARQHQSGSDGFDPAAVDRKILTCAPLASVISPPLSTVAPLTRPQTRRSGSRRWSPSGCRSRPRRKRFRRRRC